MNIKRAYTWLLSQANTWTGTQTFASLVATTADVNGGTVDSTTIGGTTPAAGTFSPAQAKGPAIINSGFAGTVTAVASTTVTFSSAADAILAGYSATNPIVGTTLISNALTRYIVSWTNATTCVVDTSVTWAGTAITSVQAPISFEVTSAGVLKRATLADGTEYFVGNVGIGTTNPGYALDVNGGIKLAAGYPLITQTSSGLIQLAYTDSSSNFYYGYGFSGAGAGSSNNVYIGAGISSNSSQTIIQLAKSGAIYFTAAGTEKMRLSAAGGLSFGNSYVATDPGAGNMIISGNVGIGTTTFGTSAEKILAIGSGVAPTTSTADEAQIWVADHGGVAGKATIHFVDEGGNYGSLGGASITVGSGTGVTVAKKGHLNRQLYTVTTTYAAYTDTDTTKGIVIATLPAKMKIVGFYADTTAAYTGGTVSAATLEVGITAEGAAEILAAHDVLSGAVTKGLADADMGTSMTRAAQIQGGYLPSWTGTTAIYATIDTTAGNLNALTTGSTTFYIETEQY